MKATGELRKEHEGIRIMLEILQTVAQKMVDGESVPKDEIDDIMEFLTIFVDTCHHGKEEEFLFPALESAGIARDNGPIGVMLHEHEQGRKFISNMKNSLGKFGSTKFNAPSFQQYVEEYVSLLNEHILKENNKLFPMAEKLFDADRDQELYKNFEELERERIGVGKHEAFHALMDKLSNKYKK